MMQLSRTAEYLETLPVTIISVDNIEADDAMAYIAKQLLPESNHVIMSTDKDFLQLVNDKISVWSPTKKKLYKPDNLKEEYEISANNFLTYRLLEGDKSDNIPGVMGVGLKTAIKRFPQLLDENVDVSIGDLLKTASDNKGIKIYDNVTNSEDKLRLNYKLMQLDEVDISGQVKLKINNIVNGKITETAKMNFQKMYIQDQMQHTIPNLESWFTQCWSKLNRFAKLSNG
jgi:DNA polymerase-1